jgi:hypothetical protein
MENLFKMFLLLSLAAFASAFVCNFSLQEGTDAYPTEQINLLLASTDLTSEAIQWKDNERKEFDCEESEYEIILPNESDELSTNPGLTPDEYEIEENDCEPIKRTIAPKFLMSVTHHDGIVANTERIEQKLEIEMCSNSGSNNTHTCHDGASPFGVIYICHQKYMTHRLVAYDKNDKKLVLDEFNLPSSCECTKVKRKEKKIESSNCSSLTTVKND